MTKLLAIFGFAAGGLVLLWYALDPHTSTANATALAAGTAAAWAIALLLIVQWVLEDVAPLWDQHRIGQAEAAAITPDVALVRAIGTLEPHQAEALMRLQARLVAVPGVAGAVLEYDLGGDEPVPVEFVSEFMEQSQGETLAPVRNWSEGTKARQWAQIVTTFFVQRGLARPSVGNRPARWVYGYESAAQWLALIDTDKSGE